MFFGTKYWRFWPPTTVIPRVSRSGKGGNITANFFSSVSTFSQPVGNGNFEPDSGLFAESTWQARLEVIQQPGDTVWIPGGWWHQVHHRSTTIGFASQYVDSHALPSVVAHLKEWNWGADDQKLVACMDGLNGSEGRAALQRLISCACRRQHELGGGFSACDPRWVMESGVDGSWPADGGADLQWAMPLRFRKKRRRKAKPSSASSPKMEVQSDTPHVPSAAASTIAPLPASSLLAPQNLWVGVAMPSDRSFSGRYSALSADGSTQSINHRNHYTNAQGRHLYYTSVGWVLNDRLAADSTEAFAVLPESSGLSAPLGRLERWLLSQSIRQDAGGPAWVQGTVRVEDLADGAGGDMGGESPTLVELPTLTAAECAAVLELSAKVPPMAGTTDGGQQQGHRNNEVRRLPRDAQTEWLYKKLFDAVESTRGEFSHVWRGDRRCRDGLWRCSMADELVAETLQISSYDAAQSPNQFYDWHSVPPTQCCFALAP